MYEQRYCELKSAQPGDVLRLPAGSLRLRPAVVLAVHPIRNYQHPTPRCYVEVRWLHSGAYAALRLCYAVRGYPVVASDQQRPVVRG